jgi:hypothetical protein
MANFEAAVSAWDKRWAEFQAASGLDKAEEDWEAADAELIQLFNLAAETHARTLDELICKARITKLDGASGSGIEEIIADDLLATQASGTQS